MLAHTTESGTWSHGLDWDGLHSLGLGGQEPPPHLGANILIAGGKVSPQDWGVGPADSHSASSNNNGQHL